MTQDEAFAMVGTLADHFESKGRAAPTLLKAGQGCTTAPLCQRAMGRIYAELRELAQYTGAPPRTRGFSGTSKGTMVTSFVKSPLQNATKLWVTVAACILLFFLALGVVWRVINGVLFLDPGSTADYKPEYELKSVEGETTKYRLPADHSALHEALMSRHHVHQREPQSVADEREQFEEDEQKQHPDDPSFIDAWDGEDVERLNLSRGVEGLKTPLYRLPFVDGQHNKTHAIGLHGQALAVPRYLMVNGGQQMDEAVGGTYALLMTADGRPKPLLVHGRPIWRRTGKGPTGGTDPSPYLFYDHTHHTWVFNNILDFRNPRPLAFLPHGALLPVIKERGIRRKNMGIEQNETSRERLMHYAHHGVPASVHWVVRQAQGGISLTADQTIRVTGDPAHTGPQDFYTLSIQKVFHAREDEELHDDDDVIDEEAEEADFMDEEEDGEDGVWGEHGGEEMHDVLSRFEEKILSLPASTRTRQHFLTHPLTLVYHTFEKVHSHYPHASIVQDPVKFLEENSHPDVETLERHFGDDSTTVPHPLRKT